MGLKRQILDIASNEWSEWSDRMTLFQDSFFAEYFTGSAMWLLDGRGVKVLSVEKEEGEGFVDLVAEVEMEFTWTPKRYEKDWYKIISPFKFRSVMTFAFDYNDYPELFEEWRKSS